MLEPTLLLIESEKTVHNYLYQIVLPAFPRSEFELFCRPALVLAKAVCLYRLKWLEIVMSQFNPAEHSENITLEMLKLTIFLLINMSNNQGSQTGSYILVIVDLPAIKQH